jgi:hypothetical protein
MTKIIDLNKSIKEICQTYPEMISIMTELGFESITNPAMLNTVGRMMTIYKGAKMKGIEISVIKQKLIENGFEVKE